MPTIYFRKESTTLKKTTSLLLLLSFILFSSVEVANAKDIDITQYSNNTATIEQFEKIAEPYLKTYINVKVIDTDKAREDKASSDFLVSAELYNTKVLAEAGIKDRGGFPLANYGRYCGPRNSGPEAPVDDLDTACRSHDRCYGRHGYGNKKCDRDFVATLQRILPHAQNPFKRLYIKAAIAVFG
ncbi:hypothetical protein HCQ94_01370 [Actinomyces sp. zg-332]|uniref:phospholipase A2 family protein n=1 Tax=Actinomyces sp. zg-332 TaxID=2708340 RepID=UPI00141DC466|nr:phospholipase A2 family protein [Actinomyces sp. zg-332]QPK94385.1 hypothetical protein HCQ94_01370 [Actinomyces sp. zg-332]